MRVTNYMLNFVMIDEKSFMPIGTDTFLEIRNVLLKLPNIPKII